MLQEAEIRPTLAPTLVAVLFLKRALAQSSPLTLYCMNERLRSGDQTESDCVWVREHHKLHHLTQSAKTMLLKSLTQCYDFQNEARWSSQSRDLMICSLALDPRFKQLAVQLCGLSRGEDYVWGVVKDAALRHRKFESGHDEITCTAPKKQKTGFFSALHQFIADGPPMSSSTETHEDLDASIDTYRKMPVLSQDADPLDFWKDNSASPLLKALLPLAASVAAVPATEAVCERLFKVGGQVLTSARLRMLGSRVEDVLMTRFNSPLADAARRESKRLADAGASGA